MEVHNYIANVDMTCRISSIQVQEKKDTNHFVFCDYSVEAHLYF